MIAGVQRKALSRHFQHRDITCCSVGTGLPELATVGLAGADSVMGSWMSRMLTQERNLFPTKGKTSQVGLWIKTCFLGL